MRKKTIFDLQLFAETEPGAAAATEPTAGDNGAGSEPTTTEPVNKSGTTAAPKYTDEDVDRILNQKFAAWQKQQEKKVSEAERLSKMTAEEKAAERMKSLEDKIRGYEQAAAKTEMMKQGRAMLQEKNINVGDELLSNLIAEDAETTKASVETFISLFQNAVDAAVKEKVRGETPRTGTSAPGMTKEQIFAVKNRTERQSLMAQYKELF